MKRSLRLRPSLAILLIAALALTGCAGLSDLFSAGGQDYGKAQEAFKQGDDLGGMEALARALKLDPKMNGALSLLSERGQASMEAVERIIDGLASPKGLADAEAMLAKLGSYESIAENLGSLLPLSMGEKLGSFDYRFKDRGAQKASILAAASDFASDDAAALAEALKLKEADALYKKAIGYSAKEPGRAETIKARAYASFEEAADKLSRKDEPETLEQAIGAWKLAAYYGGASEAEAGIAALKARIAGIWYDRGSALAKDKSYDQAIAAFLAADAAVPGYKDALKKAYTIKLAPVLDPVTEKLASIRKEYNELSKPIITVSGFVDASDEALAKMMDMIGQLRDVNKQILSVNGVLSNLGVIPVVGSAIGVVSKGIGIVQKPVGAVVGKLDKVEKSVIEPLSKATGKVKSYVDPVKDAVLRVEANIARAEQVVPSLYALLERKLDKKGFDAIEESAGYVAKGLGYLESGLKIANKGMKVIAKPFEYVAKLKSYVTPVTDAIGKLKPALSKIANVTDEINEILDKKITVNVLVKKYTFTVREIVKGLNIVKAATDLLVDGAMKLLKPVLKKLDIDIPSIPYMDEIEEFVDKVKGYYDDVMSQLDALQQVKDELLSVDSWIEKAAKAAGSI